MTAPWRWDRCVIRERDPDPSVLSSADEVKRVRPPAFRAPRWSPSPRPRLSARVGLTHPRTWRRRGSVSRARSQPRRASRRAVDRHRERVRARVEGDRRAAQVRRDTHARGGGPRPCRALREIDAGRRSYDVRVRVAEDEKDETASASGSSPTPTRPTTLQEETRVGVDAGGGVVHLSRRENAGVQRRRARAPGARSRVPRSPRAAASTRRRSSCGAPGRSPPSPTRNWRSMNKHGPVCGR